MITIAAVVGGVASLGVIGGMVLLVYPSLLFGTQAAATVPAAAAPVAVIGKGAYGNDSEHIWKLDQEALTHFSGRAL